MTNSNSLQKPATVLHKMTSKAIWLGYQAMPFITHLIKILKCMIFHKRYRNLEYEFGLLRFKHLCYYCNRDIAQL